MNHRYQLLLGAAISLSTFTGCMQDGAGQYGCSPKEVQLRDAAHKGDSTAVGRLLAEGVNPDAQCASEKNTTSLMHAAWRGNLEIVKKLLERVKNIDCQDKHGDTALMYAFRTITGGNDDETRRRKEQVAHLLIKEGASLFIQNDWGKTPVMQAIESIYPDFVKSVIEGDSVDVNAATTERSKEQSWLTKGTTLAMYAAFWDRKEILEFLIASGAKLDAKDEQGRTALMILLKRDTGNSLDSAELLIDKMTPEALNCCDVKSMTAFMHLMGKKKLEKGDVKIAELLIDKMTPEALGCRDAKTKTAFMHLLGKEKLGEGDVEIANLLIKKLKTKDLFKLDQNGKSAFHHLIDKRKTEFTKHDVSIAHLLISEMDQNAAGNYLKHINERYREEGTIKRIATKSSRLIRGSMKSARSRGGSTGSVPRAGTSRRKKGRRVESDDTVKKGRGMTEVDTDTKLSGKRPTSPARSRTNSVSPDTPFGKIIEALDRQRRGSIGG